VTKNDVLISTSSGSGLWEACARSCISKSMLHAVNGAFSEKWADVSKRCAKDVEVIRYDFGKAVDPKDIDKALSEKKFEAFCLVHNETSTGVSADLLEMSKVMKTLHI